MIEIATW